jgi:hypothetical protein
MKWLQGAYTQRYNGRHRLFGHLFQGRYKAVVVDGGAKSRTNQAPPGGWPANPAMNTSKGKDYRTDPFTNQGWTSK